MHKQLISLLNEVLVTHAPVGAEQEMDAIVERHLRECAGKVNRDAHGNIYVQFAGTAGGPLTLVNAHKDEIALIVRKIDEDGKIWVDPVGGIRPVKYGEGPFDIVSAKGVVEGVLCLGSTHSSELSTRIHRAVTGVLTWDLVYIDCKLSRQELKNRGVMVGDMAVVGRSRKPPLFLQNRYVCGYALDDKAAVVVLLLLAQQLPKTPPHHDVCLAITASEEIGCTGAAFISRHLDPHDSISVEIAPVAEEYPIQMNEQPVVLFKDGCGRYSPELSRELIAAGQRCGIECQSAVIRGFGSDASVSGHAGLNGRPACIGYPTENTHGYEITVLDALENCLKVLVEHLVGSGRKSN